MVLPYAAEAELEITEAELEYLASKYNNEKEQEGVSADTQFVYAWGLIRSKRKDDKRLGISLLHEMLRHWSDERARECYYYLALGYYRLGEYAKARKYNDDLLKMEPQNQQAHSLRRLIDEKVMRDGMIGAAIIGGVVAAAAGLMFAMTRGSRQ